MTGSPDQTALSQPVTAHAGQLRAMCGLTGDRYRAQPCSVFPKSNAVDMKCAGYPLPAVRLAIVGVSWI